MNSIGSEVLEGIQKSIDIAEKDFKGLVIANQGANFSVGANISMIFMMAIEQEYDEIDYANVQSDLLWKAIVDDIEYSGNILTPIVLLNGNINSVELDLSNQINENFNTNRCIETTVTNSSNLSGIKLNCTNTSGTSVGDWINRYYIRK